MKASQHGYVGCKPDETGQFHGHCKCGYVARGSVVKKTAMLYLIDHVAKGDAQDAKKAAKERSERGKKAWKARQRQQALAARA